MNIMTNPNFSIKQYFEESKGNFEIFSKKLFDKGVMTKNYPELGLTLVYHKYELPVTNDISRECRSLVLDNMTGNIMSYSCMMPRLNKEGYDYLLSHPDEKQIITTCYEGTYLSVFHHNDKWYVSTRRCLNAEESIFNQNNSHYDMFLDTLKSAGYDTFDSFTSNLDTSKSYYFVLIHHNNKHIIDYTDMFGPEYMRLCLTTVRDSNMNELYIYDSYKVTFNTDGVIFIPKKLDTIEMNKTTTDEGIVVKIFNSTTNLYELIKLQSHLYQFAVALGPEKNIFKGLVYLYQTNMLQDYFSENKFQNIKKIVNPLNTSESYDTVGVIDSMFKVCTSELFELFKQLYDVKTGKQINPNLYKILPNLYKELMFGIKGIYYKKRVLLHGPTKLEDIRVTHLKISDIYNYLKSVSTDKIISFLHMRKLMFNWVRLNDDDATVTASLVDFSTISKYCDKVHIKLTAIFTNKLFPSIMPTDVPQQK